MSELQCDSFMSHSSAGAAEAEALLQEGALARAEALFREAEARQKELQPNLPRLYSLRGHRYCDLLIARGRDAEATAREGWIIRGETHNLLLNKAHYQQAQAPAATQGTNLGAYVVPGLLAHAEALWRSGDADAAIEPLREAETIASCGTMLLHLAQVHLLRARIALSTEDNLALRFHREHAAVLMEKHGCGRKRPELAMLEAEIACAERAPDCEAVFAAAIDAIRGDPYEDGRTGITIDGGWWGLLPRLEALLPGDDPELISLRDARDAYNEERDRYLRSTLTEAPGYNPVNDPIGAYLDAQEVGPEEDPATEFPEVSEELVLLLFAEARLESQLRDIMRHMDLQGEPGELPFETKRAVVAELMAQSVIPPESAPQPEACEQRAPWWAFWRS